MMANLGNILKSIEQVVITVAPLLGPQVAGAAAAAQAIAKLIDDAKAAAGPEHQATIEQLTALQAQVNAHADAVIADLRGPGGGGS
jgi:hypothetical protein